MQNKVTKWHKETFPNATKKAIELKLIEEIAELKEALKYGYEKHIVEEISDVIIVSCSLLDRYGVNLETAVLSKLEINKSRIWGKENSSGDRPRKKS